jgi:hypothetical protein
MTVKTGLSLSTIRALTRDTGRTKHPFAMRSSRPMGAGARSLTSPSRDYSMLLTSSWTQTSS